MVASSSKNSYSLVCMNVYVQLSLRGSLFCFVFFCFEMSSNLID